MTPESTTISQILELQAAGLVVSAHGGQRKSVTQTVAAQEVGSLARQGGE
ncbi:hypothetical protein G3S71_000981 [Shigella dysenteriae]|nr:hypothetical protein [Shigella dysenteriae]